MIGTCSVNQTIDAVSMNTYGWLALNILHLSVTLLWLFNFKLSDLFICWCNYKWTRII